MWTCQSQVIEIPNWGQQFIADAFNEKFREAQQGSGLKSHEGKLDRFLEKKLKDLRKQIYRQ